jgi:hypothetical protein
MAALNPAGHGSNDDLARERAIRREGCRKGWGRVARDVGMRHRETELAIHHLDDLLYR